MDEPITWLLTAVASMASAIAVVYKGRIADLRATIKHERDENRALIERMMTPKKTAVRPPRPQPPAVP
jgi:hypothetical protein